MLGKEVKVLAGSYRKQNIIRNYRHLSVSGAQGHHGRDIKDKVGERDLDVIARSLDFVLYDPGAKCILSRLVVILKFIFQKNCCLEQWFSLEVSGPSASASPGNILEKQILRYHHPPTMDQTIQVLESPSGDSMHTEV